MTRSSRSTSARRDRVSPSVEDPLFDVIVVGAGASGAVVAARASEDPNRTVALVEAGPDYADLGSLPEDLVDGHDNSYVDHDWGLEFVPIEGRGTVRFPRGRVTGGSSAVNTTIALRGIPEDYDGWAARGCPEWGWHQVLPAFRRLERDLDFGGAVHHGDAGPIPIRRFPADELVPTQAAFVEAVAAFGHPACPDANDPGAWGVGPLGMNKLGRLRVSTAIGYLAPARARPNLTILANRLTRRLLFDEPDLLAGRSRRVAGIEVEGSDGEISRIRARLVVICAGAVHTPGLLVRSGIGSAVELGHLGIEPVATMDGVGANLSDHPALAVACEPVADDLVADDLPLIQTITRYTSPGSDARLDVNIELITRGARRGGPPVFLLAPSLEQVEGRGEVRQRSLDPRSMPVIRPQFGQNDVDVRRHAAALADAVEIAHLDPLRQLHRGVVFPDLDRRTPADLAAVVRRFATSGYHPVGTARMGRVGDRDAVVDQYGCCLGMSGLVVADASIMPSVPRANTNLTSIMIGERIGEWLRTEPSRYEL